jgi:hypothetical protein
MKLIALPGRNPETESWMAELTGALALGQTETLITRYRHWDAVVDPDVQGEAARLQLAADDVVIAKSLGTLVLLASTLIRPAPAYAIFIGTPILHYPAESLALLCDLAAQTPCLFIQQTADFTGGFACLSERLGDVPAAALEEVPGEDHIYADTEELAGIVTRWWSELSCGG